LLDRAELQHDALRVVVSLMPLVPSVATIVGAAPLTFTRALPLRIKRRGVEMRLVIGDAPPPAMKADPILLKEVARAYRCFDAVLARKVGSMAELASREAIDERYLRRLLPLAFLAPEIVQAIVTGAHPVNLTAKKLIRRTTLPLDWPMQKQVLGFR
jgi:site-specific DNA recombinase